MISDFVGGLISDILFATWSDIWYLITPPPPKIKQVIIPWFGVLLTGWRCPRWQLWNVFQTCWPGDTLNRATAPGWFAGMVAVWSPKDRWCDDLSGSRLLEEHQTVIGVCSKFCCPGCPISLYDWKRCTVHVERSLSDCIWWLHLMLIRVPVLVFPPETGPFLLDNDTSNFGIWGVLSQMLDN